MWRNSLVSNPFIHTNDSTPKVMRDVVIALLPCVFMAYMAFGLPALSLIAVSVGSALVAEFLFSLLFLHRIDTLGDGSAVVSGLLLSCTLGAFTPLPVVAFGAASAVVFGKLLWGGIGRNLFNPALTGREFMTVFFPTVMTSGDIWYNEDAVNHASIRLTGSGLFDQLLFNPTGALGEYSIFSLVLGGLYLLFRHRITWHIPFTLLSVFILTLSFMRLLGVQGLTFSMGGVILGTAFMATDMPTSPSTSQGKCYYGAMVGLSAALFIAMGAKYEYMSYSILLLNGVAPLIDRYVRPRVWGCKPHFGEMSLKCLLMTIGIIAAVMLISVLPKVGVQGLLYLFILYSVYRFVTVDLRSLHLRDERMTRMD